MKITVCGAAGEVNGSGYLVQTNRARVLVDKEARALVRQRAFRRDLKSLKFTSGVEDSMRLNERYAIDAEWPLQGAEFAL